MKHLPPRIYPRKMGSSYAPYADGTTRDYFWSSVYYYFNTLVTTRRPHQSVLRHLIQKDQTIPSSTVPQITWIGHSTFLIQCDGINIITDPIFGDISLFYKRLIDPGIDLHEMPGVDLMLLSHNHRDHMDAPSLRRLRRMNTNMVCAVPIGDGNWFKRYGFAHVMEHTWWQTSVLPLATTSGNPITVHFLPAVHWSQRGLFDKNRSLWGSWLIQAGSYTIYFAGDTAYSPHFSVIKAHVDPIDLALLPIGPCLPRLHMQYTHMDAIEAGQAWLDLGARVCIPMHWGTFRFGTDAFDTPLSQLNQWWSEHQPHHPDKQLHSMRVGSRLLLEPRIQTHVLHNQSVVTTL